MAKRCAQYERTAWLGAGVVAVAVLGGCSGEADETPAVVWDDSPCGSSEPGPSAEPSW